LYPVSEAFLQAVQENTREYRWTGKITTAKGVTYEFGPEQIVKGSGYITRSCCGNNEIELGSVYASEMKVTLFLDVDRYSMENACMELFYSIKLPDRSWEKIPMGIFEISEANRKIKMIELAGYDYMLRFEKSVAMDSSSGTPYEFLHFACEKCGVEMAQSEAEIAELPNGTELLGIYPDGNVESYRDLIYYVAQVLGCVCQINRSGKLELIAYGNQPVAEFTARHRFSSSYSDFVTKYTAVYSTDEVNAKSEYYCLDPDDGLTMNLGINPLLQYGMQKTREEIITNILNAISVVNYVPFDSETIGNPALDPMDVVRFSEAHADDKKISCITGITCRINGKQTLKGVGKNPLLASSKSKADKNIIGLLNQVEVSKFVICAYENASEFVIGEEEIRIVNVTFASIESTSAVFLGNVNCVIKAENETTMESYTVSHQVPMIDSIVERAVAIAKQTVNGISEDEEISIPEISYEMIEESVEVPVPRKKHPVVRFRYKLDDIWLEDYTPLQKAVDGENIFSMLYPLGNLGANSAKQLEVYMSVSGGTATVAPANCKAAVCGSGIASGYTEWDGKIVMEERINIFTMAESAMNMKLLRDSVAISMQKENVKGYSDRVAVFIMKNSAMSMQGVTGDTELLKE